MAYCLAVRLTLDKNMKLHHIAALALVGWYLMTPIPQMNLATGEPNPNTVATKMPLKYWEIADTFDSAKECKAARLALWESYRKEIHDHPHSYASLAAIASQCIATDDPRLAK